jgi:hypothetical protein
MCIINPLYFSPQVKNKPYEPTGKYAFILETGVVVNISSLQKEPWRESIL